ncbi:hypothetical protein TNCV_2745001 [Trichonephila clavipes]|nr:hypothetical protein TNCV_2745001 [Trichonephila clavipes]
MSSRILRPCMPARSPDLSPIEPAWNVLGRQLKLSRNTCELTAQLQIFFQDFSQAVILDLIDSMPTLMRLPEVYLLPTDL